jgi:DNA-binding HxlR family transcriptional regulator
MKTNKLARELKQENFECFITETMNLIGGKWKPFILWLLHQEEVVRFGELKRRIPTVTQKMLTQQLREMEKDGLVARKVYAEVPPRVEYRLTDLGRSLKPVLDALSNWGEAHLG